MTTVGYGDINPSKSDNTEMLVTIIVQLLGTTIFAYVIGGVMNLVINFDPAARAYKQEMQLLNEYMRFAKLNKLRQKRLRSQFKFFVAVKSIFADTAIMDNAPHHLRKPIFKYLSRQFLSLRYFAKMEVQYPGYLAFMFPYLKPSFVPAGSYVCRRGEFGREMYFLVRGKCRYERGGKSTDILSGDHFGAASLMVPESIPFQIRTGVKAVEDCTLLSLSRNALFQLRSINNNIVDVTILKLTHGCKISHWIHTTPEYATLIMQRLAQIKQQAIAGGAGSMAKNVSRRLSDLGLREGDVDRLIAEKLSNQKEESEVDTLGRTSSGIFSESTVIGSRVDGNDVPTHSPVKVEKDSSVDNSTDSVLNTNDATSSAVGIETGSASTSMPAAENIEAESSQTSD